MKKLMGIFLVLAVFSVLQMSFFVHFFPRGFIPNFIILLVIFLSIFEKEESSGSIAAALFGGFLMDVFSEGVIGFWALVLTIVSLAIKGILQEYVRLPIPKKF